MLKSILSSENCASCKFCCSFRRKSLWETPVFDKENKEKLEKKYPDAVFKKSGSSGFTIDLMHLYKSDDEEEEAACPFLGKKGCILESDEKPFDCSIWPLRACKIDGQIKVMLENTCPAVSKVPLEKVRELVDSGLGAKIIAYAEKNPDSIKEVLPGFFVF